MSMIYKCENQIVEKVLEKMKDVGLVSKEAYFNHDAQDDLRKEVAYRDFDFLSRLSRMAEVEIVSSALNWLKHKRIIKADVDYNETAFQYLRNEVNEKFTVTGTSITPVMERLLYMLSSLKKPQQILAIGTFCGNTLIWNAGTSCGTGKIYEAKKVYGIDIDVNATDTAKKNFSKLSHTEHIELLAEDGLKAIERLEGPFDYVYLDADGKELGKGLYLELLKKVYDKITDGGWILAHDIVVPTFSSQFEEYLSFVRDKTNFQESILFDVDAYGLELTIK